MKRFLAILFVLFLAANNAFAAQYYYDETANGKPYLIEVTNSYGGSSAFQRLNAPGYYPMTSYYRHTVSGSHRKKSIFVSTQENSRFNVNNDVKKQKTVSYRNGITYYN